MIAEFWLLPIHTLCGQYESFTSNVVAIFRKQMHFKRLWDSILIFREDRDHIIWMYIVSVILETMSTNFVYGHSIATVVGGIGYIACSVAVWEE